MSYYIGEIIPFSGEFAPRDWAFCHGQLLSRVVYAELFSVIGTRFGSTSEATFRLPDLRGRAVAGANLVAAEGSPAALGHKAGEETITLRPEQVPVHSHHATAKPWQIGVAEVAATEASPLGHVLAQGRFGTSDLNMYATNPSANAYLADTLAIDAKEQTVGRGEPVSIMQPYCVLNFIIALKGIQPRKAT